MIETKLCTRKNTSSTLLVTIQKIKMTDIFFGDYSNLKTLNKLLNKQIPFHFKPFYNTILLTLDIDTFDTNQLILNSG